MMKPSLALLSLVLLHALFGLAVGRPVFYPVAVIEPSSFRKDDGTPVPLTVLQPANQNGTHNGSSQLLALNDAFWDLVDAGAAVRVVAKRNYSFAHEAPVWFPETRQLFFVSNRLVDPVTGIPYVELSLLSLDSGNVTILTPSPPILMANGGTPFGPHTALVCSQGQYNSNGGLVVLDIASGQSMPLNNNWYGLAFNSPNDVAVHGPSGAIFFTDPPYGYAQGFRPPPQVGNWVWRFDPATNYTTPAADGFVKPNGVAFSPNFTVAYVTETGAVDGTGAPASFAVAAPAIYAFDVEPDAAGLPLLRNRRLFAVPPSGIPDGIKLDSQGNVYVGVPGGVDVFSSSGQALGSIAVGASANLAFAGSELVMLQEYQITVLPMKVKGMQLPLQKPL